MGVEIFFCHSFPYYHASQRPNENKTNTIFVALPFKVPINETTPKRSNVASSLYRVHFLDENDCFTLGRVPYKTDRVLYCLVR